MNIKYRIYPNIDFSRSVSFENTAFFELWNDTTMEFSRIAAF